MAWMSLYSTVWVYWVAPGGTPFEEGTPSADPDPALTRTASCAPWNPPFIFTTPNLPVYPRAVRMACMVASVPELARRTMSAEGTAEAILLTSASSGSDGAP